MNLSDIDVMLRLVNHYGLSHVCANDEFENIELLHEYPHEEEDIARFYEPFNFPYLDIHFKSGK